MVDLIQEDIKFEEEAHKYTYQGEELTSVTTYIAGLFPDFNKDIAQYSAKAVNNEISAWDGESEPLEINFVKSIKLFGDRWRQEVTSRKQDGVGVTSEDVLFLWDFNGQRAAREGTRIHNLIEDAVTAGYVPNEVVVGEPIVTEALKLVSGVQAKYSRPTVYAEARVAGVDWTGAQDIKIPLAGTVDLVIANGDNVSLVDWKTNDSLYKKPYGKGVAQSTLDLDNSKFVKYTLQLSLYAYILETYYNKKIDSLAIGWLDGASCHYVPIDYQRDKIIEILTEDKLL